MQSPQPRPADRRRLLLSVIAAPLASLAIVKSATRWFTPKRGDRPLGAPQPTNEDRASIYKARQQGKELARTFPLPRWLPKGFTFEQPLACQDHPDHAGPFIQIENNCQLRLMARPTAPKNHSESINTTVAYHAARTDWLPALQEPQMRSPDWKINIGAWEPIALKSVDGQDLTAVYRYSEFSYKASSFASHAVMVRRDGFTCLLVSPTKNRLSREDVERIASSVS